jgi:prepilin-type processing-associated H-X9-DG protein
MPQINCPHCGQTFDLTDEQAPQYVGQTITCTSCQKPFTVPGGGALPVQSMAYASPHYVGPQQTNGLAIASLVSGCVGFVIPIIPGIIAIILGIIGIRKTRDPAVGGKGLAIAGIAVGGTSMVLSICTASLMMSILIPSVNRASETANRIKCASNMRQIGQALLLYANDNHGQYPPNLEDLLPAGNVTSNVFICPSSNDTPASGSTPQALAAALSAGGHESYIYIPNLNSSASADTIVLYEPLSDHSGDGMNVLFGDGHVEFDVKQQAAGMIAEIQAGFNPPRHGHY